jgi:hypothetical protein
MEPYPLELNARISEQTGGAELWKADPGKTFPFALLVSGFFASMRLPALDASRPYVRCILLQKARIPIEFAPAFA